MADPLLRRDPFQLVGTVLDGRFRVEREVAEGGFGVVYYAIQVALERPVALKVLKTPPGMDAQAAIHFRDKFAAEAKTIARIRHPNIVDVHDFGISPMPSGMVAPWMALEWLKGTTLEEYLAARRGRGGQPAAVVLSLLRPVLRALAHAHRQGIAHRDIKPANIMVVATESGGATTEGGLLLRVLDFGIAKLMDGGETPGTGQTRTSGAPAFSPHYAAPEQVAFGRTGPWTDVHALGLILSEMLVDGPPYQEQSMQLFEEVMSARRPTPRTRGLDVGPWEDVIGKALALSPGQRWKDASDLLAALEGSVAAATLAATALAPVRAAIGRPSPRQETLPFDVASPAAPGLAPSVRMSGRGRLRRWILAGAAMAIAGSLGVAFAVFRGAIPAPTATKPEIALPKTKAPVVVPLLRPPTPSDTPASNSAPGAGPPSPTPDHPAGVARSVSERVKGAKRAESSHRHAAKIEIE